MKEIFTKYLEGIGSFTLRELNKEQADEAIRITDKLLDFMHHEDFELHTQ
jgi:hypothetical protein